MKRCLPALVTLPLVLWGCSGDTSPARRIDVPESQLRSAAAQQRGREIFLRQCALCHGERANGVGVRRNLSSQPQDFTDPSWSARIRPEEVYLVIREGRRGTAMAGWKALGEEQTWDLVAYLLAVAGEAG